MKWMFLYGDGETCRAIYMPKPSMNVTFIYNPVGFVCHQVYVLNNGFRLFEFGRRLKVQLEECDSLEEAQSITETFCALEGLI